MRQRPFIVAAAFALALLPTLANAHSDTRSLASASRPYRIEFNVAVPVRDGTRLNATIIRPVGEGRYPVVLILTPYGADRYHDVAAFFAKNGFVGAIVDVRGRGDSEGHFTPYATDGDDGYDTVEWLAKQDYSDGRVVMRGASYTGWVQWAVAARKPPSLRAIAPGAPPFPGLDTPGYRGVGMPYRTQWSALVAGRQRNTNFNEDRDYWLGLAAELARGDIGFGNLETEAGLSRAVWPEAGDKSPDDPYWNRLNPTDEQMAQIDVPVLSITGAYDGAKLGTFTHHDRFVAFNPAMASRSRLLIGPWDHAGVTTPRRYMDGVDLGSEAELDMLELHRAWFRHVLDGTPLPATLSAPVNYYLLGANQWRGSNARLGQQRVRFMLSGGPASPDDPGGLVTREAKRGAATFRIDPTAPAELWHPYFAGMTGGLRSDPLPAKLKGRGLIFETAAVGCETDLIGEPLLDLAMRLDVPDADLTAVLYDVDPAGATTTLSWDVLRLRYRGGLQRPMLWPAGSEQRVQMTLGWSAWRVAPGHKLRLVLTSPTLSMLWQRNRHSGKIPAEETLSDSRTAQFTILTGARSHLTLPLRPTTVRNQPPTSPHPGGPCN
jgi:hypothetical protein